MIKLYRAQKDEDGKDVLKTCNCEREQRALMISAGWTTDPSGKAEASAPVFTCDECGAKYDEEQSICSNGDCESEDFTAAE